MGSGSRLELEERLMHQTGSVVVIFTAGGRKLVSVKLRNFSLLGAWQWLRRL